MTEAGGGMTHLDDSGSARMVDVGDKTDTARVARAEAVLAMRAETLELISSGDVPKGDVFAAARIAGISAAKRTSELIPLCHQLRLDSVQVDFRPDSGDSSLTVVATARATDRTGVEMEALIAAAVACLTVYDMCKAVDRAMEVTSLRLLEKSGGRSGTWKRQAGR